MPDFSSLVKHFSFEGNFLDAAPYGAGHINGTYATRFQQPDGRIRRYILQQINTQVFKAPEKVMHNIQKVTSHLRRKLEGQERAVITLVPTTDGGTFYQTPAGEFWRAEVFIEGAQTYLTARDTSHYYNAARAFGGFQKHLDDFPIHELHDTIPDFHHTGKRFAAFLKAVEQDASKRAARVKPEIDFVLQRAAQTTVLIDMAEKGQIPLRVTHNDTKLDNVMIDDVTGEGICVIDLDTVMPGFAVFDFGDTVRSCANTGLEDEPDLSKVNFDLSVFDRLAHGFLDATRETLTPIEIGQLAFGAKLITFEQGIRFLTDYLNGDIYYKIHRPNHNLDRARTQLKLVQGMEDVYDVMLATIERYGTTA